MRRKAVKASIERRQRRLMYREARESMVGRYSRRADMGFRYENA
jgi:hypothetical protein